jgi:16S rRNA G966 N2-methylase RsmD
MMAKYNDIDLSRWREYEDIRTDSLWVIDRRDNSGAHSGNYHGNFIPQIPNQLLRRYTKAGDWVLDPFMGSGTTLIEAQRLCRNSIGIDIQEPVIAEAFSRIHTEQRGGVKTLGFVGDSRRFNIKNTLAENEIEHVQFVILHPPYWDIIHFSDDPNDISNTTDLIEFLTAFSEVVDNACSVLERNRYCALVIGDKYANSEIVPLGFHCMSLMISKGFKQKAIIVKNFEDTKGKSNQQSIWRYRALSNDFYIFKHEYIFVFKKI